MDDPTPLLIRDGWWVRFSSRIIDESHTAWGIVNKEDAYLFGIEFSHEYHESFAYSEAGDFNSLHRTTLSSPRSNMILSITQSQVNTSEGISLFVANAFENLRDELGEDKMSQICNFLQSFTSEVSPGASTMALVDVVRYRAICYFFDTIRDEEARLTEFRVKLVHAHDNGFNMKLVEYKVGTMSDEICTICLDKFNEDVKVVKTVCSHHFHEKCIGFWMMHQTTCPVCRNIVGID